MSTISLADASRQLSRLVNRAAYGRDLIVLTSRGKPKAVLVGVDAFEKLIGMSESAHRPLMPLDDFRREFRQALAQAGYDTRGKIIELTRQVKRELVAERETA